MDKYKAGTITSKFPSPHGDKFQLFVSIESDTHKCFRPPTGINFNMKDLTCSTIYAGFRPLTGINFN